MHNIKQVKGVSDVTAYHWQLVLNRNFVPPEDGMRVPKNAQGTAFIFIND
jgi:hypothetical protein